MDNPITTKKIESDASTYKLVLLDKEIVMPEYTVSSEYRDVFDLIVNKCYDCIHTTIDKDVFLSIIQGVLRGQTLQDDRLVELSEFAYNLYTVLYQLDTEGKNGIWSFILKNSFRPSLISARFNGIVSNTPWLAMSKIGSNPYKGALKSIAKEIGINPTDSSFPHLELATVFLLSSIHRYLQKGGLFGCILPDSVLNGGQHTKFRTGKFNKKRVKADFDEIWTLPADTFKNRSLALFGIKRQFNEVSQYPGRHYSSKDSYSPTIFNVSNTSSKKIWTEEEIQDAIVRPCKYAFKQGADIMPRCFYFFTLQDTGETVHIASIKNNESYSYFKKDQKIGKDLSYNASGIPKTLLKSILISNILLPFNIGELPYAVLPVEKADDKWQEISNENILSFQRSVINLFNNIKRDYKTIKHKDDMYGNTLNMWNKLEQQNLQQGKFLVVYGAGGKNICSAYMFIDNADRYIVDQTLYWTIVETEDEAIYLSAMLNCPTLNETIAAFQPQGIFGERHVHTLPLEYIPKYNHNDSNHIELVNITKVLCGELSSAITDDLLDPNSGTLPSRRKKVSKLLLNLPSYASYVTICESILQNNMENGANEENFEVSDISEVNLNSLNTNNVERPITSEVSTLNDEETIPKAKVIPVYDEYHEGCVPLYTLRAACGYFEDGEVPEEEGWIDASGNGFTPDPKRHFAVHAKGDSMLNKIKDGDICVFEWYRAGSREGEIVLTESDEKDIDYGGMYTIKKYQSEKLITDEGWQHTKVELKPLNNDYDVIELNENSECRTIGIFKCVLR
jgi:SOS-response transcriptional repressor LexA